MVRMVLAYFLHAREASMLLVELLGPQIPLFQTSAEMHSVCVCVCSISCSVCACG